jgi:secreted PhoX family phosphatase
LALADRSRRAFLTRTALMAGAAATAPLEALLARTARGESVRSVNRGGYGPLMPVADMTTGLPLLMLPEGFAYRTFGYRGDPLDGAGRTPPAHDGMAAFAVPGAATHVRLVRNHEIGHGDGAFTSDPAYDRAAGGGTTTIEFDTATGEVIRGWASLGGTIRNCAGGETPWGSWLTCEESAVGPTPGGSLTRPHGYVFDVPVEGRADPVPLVDMGRFVHEAVAVDPRTGIVYETEDRGRSGFYRFTPKTRGRLADGGTLEMLAVRGQPRLDTRKGQKHRVTYPVEWVPIDRPNRVHHDETAQDSLGVFMQGYERGGAAFARGEGAWAGLDKIFFVATSGGDAEEGQVWEYDPQPSTLRLVFESPGADVLNMPDNVCVSPRGGLVLCEDGSGEQFVRGLTVDGRIFAFALNTVVLDGQRNGLSGDYRRSEFAGACYSPDGRWMFVNVQNPGITAAITGPWGTGAL